MEATQESKYESTIVWGTWERNSRFYVVEEEGEKLMEAAVGEGGRSIQKLEGETNNTKDGH